MPLKILHTADVHLGAKFLGLGRKGREQRAELLRAFEDTVDLALREGVDLFLVAGDLFDSEQPPPRLVSRVVSLLNRLSEKGVPVCISPGTHDPYGEKSVYALPELRAIEGLKVFTGERLEPHNLPELDCTVYGNANTHPFANRQPLSGFAPRDDSRWRIGIIHASFEIPDVTEDTYLVTGEDLKGSGLHYLALGHFHSMSDRSSGRVTAFYPGSPEMVRMQPGDFGNVLLVEVDEGAKVRPLRVGRRGYREARVRAEVADEQGLEDLLKSLADPDTVLHLFVEGLRRPGCPDIAAMVEEHRGDFFHLSVTDRSSPAPASVDPSSYPPGSPAEAFLNVLASRMEASTGSEREEVLEAMQTGLAMLIGGEGE